MGWKERSTADKFGMVGLVIGACAAVFFAVDTNFVMRFLILALGAAIGYGAGRLLGEIVARR